MKYLALTQPTANWLLANRPHLEELNSILPNLIATPEIRVGVLILGTVRVTSSQKGDVVCMWNTDYLSGTGVEQWGLIRLDSPMGLFDQDPIRAEVFERCVYAMNQRLQGLLVGDRLIHRSQDSVQTCLAGRGEEARQFSIAWVEGNFTVKGAVVRGVLLVGPEHDFKALTRAADQQKDILPRLVLEANSNLQAAGQKPALDSAKFEFLAESLMQRGSPQPDGSGPVMAVPSLGGQPVTSDAALNSLELTYSGWLASGSPLSKQQRQILAQDVILQQPVRIIGAAGSGKTLLMQLLAIRRLEDAKIQDFPLRILYVVHNSAMMSTMWTRFAALGASEFLVENAVQELQVKTLFEHSQEELKIDAKSLIDTDAQQTKQFQLAMIKERLRELLDKRRADLPQQCPLLEQVADHEELFDIFATLLAMEIGVAIKGHGLNDNRNRYVGSEQALSRLHAIMKPVERDIVFDVFEAYQHEVTEVNGVLDSDDVALTLLGQLRTPLWALKRKKLGFDFVFVDETQLFNENERRLFSLLTRGDMHYVPVVLALDQAQEVRGAVSSGFGLLGVEGIADANLRTVHRSTKAILSFAFHIIQQTTDLFGPEFPDFTTATTTVVPDDHRLASPPKIISVGPEAKNLGRFVVKHARSLRKQNLRQVCVVVHAERYWGEVHDEFQKEEKEESQNLLVLNRRGERIDPTKPAVVLTRPENVGGQEFDAVILVGLEQGVTPPRVEGHEGLAAALEQQALREIYLATTRARYRLIVVLSVGATITKLLESAVKKELLKF